MAASSQEWVALVACLQSPTERTKPGVWQKALSGLAQLRFPLPGVEEKDARFVLTLFTPANLQDDPRPAAHYCKFVTNILYHQDNLELDEGVLEGILATVVGILRRYSRGPDANTDVTLHGLRALSSLVYDSINVSVHLREQLIGSSGLLESLASITNDQLQARRLAIQCLGYACANLRKQQLTSQHASLPKAMSIFRRVLIENLQAPMEEVDPYIRYKLLSAALKTLQHVVDVATNIPDEEALYLLATVKALMFCDIAAAQQVARHPGSWVVEVRSGSSTKFYDPLERYAPPTRHAQSVACDEAQLQTWPPSAIALLSSSSDVVMRTAAIRRAEVALELAAQRRVLATNRCGAVVGHKAQQTAVLRMLQASPNQSCLTRHPQRTKAKSMLLFRHELELSFLHTTRASQSERAIRVSASQVRAAATEAAHHLLRRLPARLLHVYWQTFIPDAIIGAGAGPSAHGSLLESLELEVAPQAQQATLQLIATMINQSSNLIKSASNRRRGTAFTSLAESFANMLYGLHRGLVQLLQRANTFHSTVACIRCLEQLLVIVPYAALQDDYASLFATAVAVLLESAGTPHVHHNLVSTGLRLLANVFTSQVDQSTFASRLHAQPIGSDTLWGLFLSMAENDSDVVNTQLQGEAIHTLSAHVCGSPAVSLDAMDRHLKLVERLTSSSSDAALLLHTVKLAEDICVALQRTSLSESHLERHSPTLSSVVCDAIAAVGETMFQRLEVGYDYRAYPPGPGWKQRHLPALLLGLSEHEQPSIRAAACRALGQLLNYNCLADDGLFVTDCLETLVKRCEDSAVAVTARASWALGNFGDVVLRKLMGSNDYRCDFISQDLRTAVNQQTCKMLRSAKDKMLHELGQLLRKAAKHGPAKVRWNACRGLGCYMDACQRSGLRDERLQMVAADLVHELVAVSNYKVKTSVVNAFCWPGHRLNIDGFPVDLLKVVWEHCRKPTEAAEHQYQLNLKQRVR
ncbi:uncharacterized protein MONBRDRAFT_24478 [Monosiga brevicollis MX1]|uniref:DUF4042 domain-containing protein n=1 Tax=Monosiga brevicollis TaxID=81824 RepID=A9UWJ0_MONBE|nr:uncharacterized protein MONBRDRAFT_24478 [Monosiga brevicollis MX1]EDQ90221.1 predicted protein [Monosiga brevicollis MX1]|eukprot:XP_001744988.1 hypothetical protein [Monosiga brevicollis MX1]